jgi:hypothetical protein
MFRDSDEDYFNYFFHNRVIQYGDRAPAIQDESFLLAISAVIIDIERPYKAPANLHCTQVLDLAKCIDSAKERLLSKPILQQRMRDKAKRQPSFDEEYKRSMRRIAAATPASESARALGVAIAGVSIARSKLRMPGGQES